MVKMIFEDELFVGGIILLSVSLIYIAIFGYWQYKLNKRCDVMLNRNLLIKVLCILIMSLDLVMAVLMGIPAGLYEVTIKTSPDSDIHKFLKPIAWYLKYGSSITFDYIYLARTLTVALLSLNIFVNVSLNVNYDAYLNKFKISVICFSILLAPIITLILPRVGIILMTDYTRCTLSENFIPFTCTVIISSKLKPIFDMEFILLVILLGSSIVIIVITEIGNTIFCCLMAITSKNTHNMNTIPLRIRSRNVKLSIVYCCCFMISNMPYIYSLWLNFSQNELQLPLTIKEIYILTMVPFLCLIYDLILVFPQRNCIFDI